MLEEERRGPPHGVLIAGVITLLVLGPVFLGDGGDITETIAETMNPVVMLLIPITLVLVIQFLSSPSSSLIADFFCCSRDSIHRVGGSPAGVAFLLLLVVFLVYARSSLFAGDDSNE